MSSPKDPAIAVVATELVYDFHFYHHISNPYIRRLRYQFIRRLEHALAAVPDEICAMKPCPAGDDTTREVRELTRFIVDHYTEVFNGNSYVIHERRAKLGLAYRSSR